MARPRVFLFLLVLAGAAFAHGGGHRPPPPPPPGPPTIPPVPPPVTPPPGPQPPTTPPGGPGGPTTPPGTPKPSPPRTGRPARGTRSAPPTANSWRVWWEYNREYLLGLRQRIRESARGVVTGPGRDREADPMAGRRDEVRGELRALALNPATDPKLRSSALIALGRLATAEDHALFLEILRRTTDEDVVAAALLGFGVCPPVEGEDAAASHGALERMAGHPSSYRVRGFALIALGLRARHDKVLGLHLARRCAEATDSYDAATLGYACGLPRDTVLLPELLSAARDRRVGTAKLSDTERAQVVSALGLVPSPLAADLCGELLGSRRAGLETKRAAALSLGRLLREQPLDAERGEAARSALLQAFDRSNDPVLQGYAAVALGAAPAPAITVRCTHAVDRGGDVTLKAYAALALGLAAPRVGDGEARRIRAFLLDELRKTHDVEVGSALSLALGLAGATDAVGTLLDRVRAKSLPAPLRGAAAEALGLLGPPGAEVHEALLEALREGPPELVEGATLGLGLLGRRGVAEELVARLGRTSSGIAQGRLTLALGHLGHAAAVDPLLALLRDRTQKGVVRELAAVALGLLGGTHEVDPLFELDAYFNPNATTLVTHELLTIF